MRSSGHLGPLGTLEKGRDQVSGICIKHHHGDPEETRCLLCWRLLVTKGVLEPVPTSHHCVPFPTPSSCLHLRVRASRTSISPQFRSLVQGIILVIAAGYNTP